jgi:sterol desaturase/sphingolipid hydroxylase (fatty acid hydroxylase superfamily)
MLAFKYTVKPVRRRDGTMDEARFGTRDRRGHWWPREHAGVAPVFVLPPQPMAFLRWLPDYFLPWNLLFLASGTVFWLVLTPGWDTLATLTWDWPLLLLLRNTVAVALFYGAIELHLYVRRRQGTRFKYNPAFPDDRQAKVFLFGRQSIDNAIRTFATGVPVWTAYEVFVLWAFASGLAPMSSFATDPVWLAVVILLVPVFHHVHFYLVHRLIHVPALYRRVHAVHHRAVNPSPWSSLSMHPVEHVLYFSGVLVHLAVWSHPLVAIYHLHYAGFGAAVGHIGFHTVEVGEDAGIDTHAFTHYLHHKYFEVNYGEGLVPIDKWMGTWHDGSPEGDRLMEARRSARAGRGDPPPA